MIKNSFAAKVFFLLLIVAATVAVWWYGMGGVLPTRSDLASIAQKATDIASQTAGDISAPPPLRAERESPTAFLTYDGVVLWTNAARRENGGLSALATNVKLDAAAEAKLADMFDKQYFEHISPSGAGPGELVDAVGYAYIAVGENLAEGNFEDDRVLVDAWMASPGHRANILDADYMEIGVAVGRGVFEGRETWIAVQEFGRPLSACPQPDRNLLVQIEADQAELESLESRADALRAELESRRGRRPMTGEQADEYNAKADEYNALVERINALISSIQGEVTVYNGQIEAFNACAGG